MGDEQILGRDVMIMRHNLEGHNFDLDLDLKVVRKAVEFVIISQFKKCVRNTIIIELESDPMFRIKKRVD
jgi:hypothetical protein